MKMLKEHFRQKGWIFTIALGQQAFVDDKENIL